MTMITPARRAQLSLAGRMGGLATAATIDRAARAAAGQSAFRASFLDGHGCRRCPRIEIPDHLPDRASRADALYRLHMLRIRHAR